jgi:hypothetical protein
MDGTLRIPILTYHALHAPGWDYASNDHIALASDLLLIRQLGRRVVDLKVVADAVINNSVAELAAEKVVGISFDDGTDHDFIDFSHPDYGYLKSMARVLREEACDLGFPNGQARATSFVIVSPDARVQLDRACIAGRNQWRDDWWLEAAAEGTLRIANHSWDHVHPALATIVAEHATRGLFESVSTWLDAEREIGDAEEFLRGRLGQFSTRLLAYPYGRYSDYVVSEYLPHQDRVVAAFAVGGSYVTNNTSRWAIPRFTCQEHWRTPDELRQILIGSAEMD